MGQPLAVPQRRAHPPRVELDDDLEIPPGFQGSNVLPQENTSFAAVGPFVFPDVDPEILPNMEDSDEDEDLDFVQGGQHDADELVALASSHPTKFKATIESERPQFWPDAAVRNQQLARSLASEIQPAMFSGLASDATAPTSSAVGEHPMTLHIAHQRFSVSPGLESAVSLSPMIETIVNPELLNPLPQASSSQAPQLSSQAPRLSSQAPRPSSQAPRPSSQAHLPLSQASPSQVSHLLPQIPPGNIPGLGAFGLNDPMVSDAAGPAGSGIFNLPPLPPPTTQSMSTYSAETDLVRDGGRLKIMRQNPTLRAVIQQAVEILHGDIVMINAFPMAD
ncbi:hypothetical protein OF83DRAFT_1172142 [Amylostereum chailletii]|nr:hypothetical protein OF83DRAFT_1172142 [Amylostereum chailletii]